MMIYHHHYYYYIYIVTLWYIILIIMIPQQRKPILEKNKKKRCGCWGYHRSLFWNHHHCYTLLLWLLGKKNIEKHQRRNQFNGDTLRQWQIPRGGLKWIRWMENDQKPWIVPSNFRGFLVPGPYFLVLQSGFVWK